MVATGTAFLVLRTPALLQENQANRDRLLTDVARQLGIEGEVDLTTITNIAAEGTDTAARFPVSQDTLNAAAGSIDDSTAMASLFLIPDAA